MKKTRRRAVVLCVVQVIFLTLLLTTNPVSYQSWDTPTPIPQNHNHQFMVRHDPQLGLDVRVVVFVISTRMTMAACMSVASGYLSGIPVFVAGYDPPANYIHIHKIQGSLEASQALGLTTSDVVMFIDSDTVFTGPEQLLAMIDAFIAESAPSAKYLNARAVREGRMRAPMIASREDSCYAVDTLGPREACQEAFKHTNEAYNAYARAKGIPQYVERFSFINSGAYIARVWALEEFTEAYYRYMQQHPLSIRGTPWRSDQSLFNALYLDLRSWEIQADALASADAPSLGRSRYGLRAGLLEVDERRDLSNRWQTDVVISNEFWLQDRDREAARTISPFAKYFDAYTANVFKAYKQPLRRYPLPPFGGSSAQRHRQFFGSAVPPLEVADHGGNVLLATVPRRVAPAILHDVSHILLYMRSALGNLTLKTNTEKETLSAVTSKFPRMANKVPHLSWYIPLKYDSAGMSRAKEYLSQLHIPLISERSTDVMGSYKELCMEAFATDTTVDPALYKNAVDAYNLFFDYYQ